MAQPYLTIANPAINNMKQYQMLQSRINQDINAIK